MAEEINQNVSTSAESQTVPGATVVPEYVERGLTIYGITEVEMDDLSLMSTGMTIALSVCTLCIGLAIPTAISIGLSSANGLAAFALWALVATFAAVALGSGLLIVPLSRRRQTVHSRIKRQSSKTGKR
jgi:hypothetical protein